MRTCDEFDGGFGWMQEETFRRTSHALVADGRVWLIDPVDEDGLEERVRAAGEPAGGACSCAATRSARSAATSGRRRTGSASTRCCA
jgi:hypothetical protein